MRLVILYQVPGTQKEKTKYGRYIGDTHRLRICKDFTKPRLFLQHIDRQTPIIAIVTKIT